MTSRLAPSLRTTGPAALAVCTLAVFAVTGLAPTAAAQELVQDVELEAQGGVAFKAPDWKQGRKDEAVLVLERAADSDKKVDFGVVVLSIEEGPTRTDKVDWERIRDNIVKAAKDAGGELELKVQGDFADVEGLAGRHLDGTLKSGERVSVVHMVALVGQGVMVSVTAIGPKSTAKGNGKLVSAVAATAVLKRG